MHTHKRRFDKPAERILLVLQLAVAVDVGVAYAMWVIDAPSHANTRAIMSRSTEGFTDALEAGATHDARVAVVCTAPRKQNDGGVHVQILVKPMIARARVQC